MERLPQDIKVKSQPKASCASAGEIQMVDPKGMSRTFKPSILSRVKQLATALLPSWLTGAKPRQRFTHFRI